MDRTEAARRLLADADGEAIDRLAALAARLLGTASAQVVLFGDEQTPLVPRPRAPEDLIARTFAGHAAIPAQGAYLGAPVEVDGHRVGVLCVYDDEPFEWTVQDRETLAELALAVGAELERRALAGA